MIRTFVAAAILALAGSTEVQAAPGDYAYQVYTGVVAGGTDPYGYFGDVGGDLTGMHYEARFTVSTDDNVWISACCGSADGAVTGDVYASLTINGRLFTTTGEGASSTFLRQINDTPDPYTHQIGATAAYFGNGFIVFGDTIMSNNAMFPSVDPGVSFSYDMTDDDYALELSQLGSLTSGYLFFGDMEIDLSAQHVSSGMVRADAAVPEPASWALMVAGFGLAGIGLRSRKRALTFA